MKLFSTHHINTSIAAMAGLVLLIFLLAYFETGTTPVMNNNRQTEQHPNFYLINSYSEQYDKSGSLDMIMVSQSVQHNPKDDSISLQQPYFQLFQDGVTTWEIKALSGTAYNRGHKIDLQHRVTMINQSKQSSLKTPQLFIYPDKKRANTEQTVTLQNPNSVTQAIGMEADLNTKHITLLDQVRVQYEPTMAPDNAE